MHILKINYQSNPNVGLFGWANDKICLVGKGFNSKAVKDIEKALKVPVHQISLCSTDLIGVFCVGNNECILVPSIIMENEIIELDKICKKAGMRIEIISTELTALGNNILCNDIGALVNPDYSARVKKQIRTALRVNLIPGEIWMHGIPGSLCVTRKNKAVAAKTILEKEEDTLKKLLNVECTYATVNFGSMHLRSGIIINSNGFIVGDMSTGVEISNVDEGLGFLEKE
ncbi:MAG: translation initiation factor IF-6 [Candidatus Woesearchaeota archaeon]